MMLQNGQRSKMRFIGLAWMMILVFLTVRKEICYGFQSHSRSTGSHHAPWKIITLKAKEISEPEPSLTTDPIIRPGSMAAATKEQGRVPYGESSRQYRRTVYSTQENWIEHRSSFGIINNLKNMLFSGVIRQVKDDVGVVTLAAIFVVLWNGFIGNQDSVLPHLALPSQPFTLSSPALGLLLVFRTNASYTRWMEARTKWSSIQTHTINLARMASTFSDTSSTKGKHAVDELVVCSWALSRCLMNRLLFGNDDEAEFTQELTEAFDEVGGDSYILNNLLSSSDRPMTALMELSFALDKLPIDEKKRLEMDKSIIILGECVASCERIFTSPIPLFYTRHAARFLSLWMLLMPFPLYDLFVERNSILTPQVFMESLVLVPAVAVLAIFLFGIQELSVQLEEPFSILPLQRFCNEIKSGSESMVRRSVEEGTRREKNGPSSKSMLSS